MVVARDSGRIEPVEVMWLKEWQRCGVSSSANFCIVFIAESVRAGCFL